MTDAERTRNMSDDEVLADLRAQRKPQGTIPPYTPPEKFSGRVAFQMVVVVLATIGLCAVLAILQNALH